MSERADPRLARLPVGRDALPILEASPNPIVAVRASDGQILYANPQVEATFGWPATELIGGTVERLVPQALHDRHVAHRADFAAHPVARPMGTGLDLAGVRRDGSQFPVEISLLPLETAEGLVVLATLVDISSRRRLEEELFEARKMESIGRLSGGIAHDFNNILTAIIGFADLALARPPEDDGTFELTTIRQAAQRAAGLTQQLLAFGRRQVMRPEVIDPNHVISDTEPLLRRLIGEQIEILVSLTPSLGRIKVDPTQLGQVILNLAINARDAMPDGGRLVIRSQKTHLDARDVPRHPELGPGDYVVISVSDTGIGMDKATQAHIFEPFFTTKEVGKGTGLGLATTYGIVKQSGGNIWLYSEPGRGTTFRIYFPIVEAPEEAMQQERSRTPVATRPRVLLVEDEPILRELARRILAGAGYEVEDAPNPGVALDMAERPEADFGLLVSDVVMPQMTGADLARRLRLIDPGLPVVLMSGYAQELVTSSGEDYVFVAKPFTATSLLDAVACALEGVAQTG
jgi:two-component system, cell cycle sensor histidine kinase and response regulator CckA